ncbi:MAG: hypothetical protein IJ123_00450 [Blautia sp.]|nr:hypothetical protein [Blautia sp.]
MMTRNDLSLSERSAGVTEETYTLNARSEKSLASLDAVSAKVLSETDSREEYLTKIAGQLPSGMTLEGDTVSWTEEEGKHTLNCSAVLPADSEDGHVMWKTHRLVVEMEMVNLWN